MPLGGSGWSIRSSGGGGGGRGTGDGGGGGGGASGVISDALSTPIAKSVGLASNTIQAYPIWLPADVTTIDIAISNRNCLDTANHGGPVTGISVAGGTPNSGLTAWATPPTIVTGQSVDGAGGLTWITGFPVVRNAAGFWMAAWGMTAAGASGSFVCQENSNGWGLQGVSTDLTGLTGVTPRSVGTVVFGFMSVRYATSMPRLVTFGHSIEQGILAQRNTTPAHVLPSLGGSFAAGTHGCGSLTAQAVAGGRSIDFDACSFSGNDVLLHLVTNDLIALRTKTQIETDIITVMGMIRALGARKVGLATELPSSSYSGGQNTILTGYNADVMALSLGNDFYVDLYSAVKDPAANQILPALAADAFHPNPAGQAAMRTPYPTLLP